MCDLSYNNRHEQFRQVSDIRVNGRFHFVFRKSLCDIYFYLRSVFARQAYRAGAFQNIDRSRFDTRRKYGRREWATNKRIRSSIRSASHQRWMARLIAINNRDGMQLNIQWSSRHEPLVHTYTYTLWCILIISMKVQTLNL